ncbi:MAG: hypothetical protein KGL39_41375 [Patescibacteria group bacterium]|nr:hypothetical protein [Patescibacteria group bacterium]
MAKATDSGASRVPEFKEFKLASANVDENVIKGDAAVIGNIDRDGDVIFPSFFSADVLDRFVTGGFIADCHDWTKQIGTPKVAQLQGNKLYSEGEFHSTSDAQDVRTKCSERLERGKTVGLSIGFMTALDKIFINGPALLEFAKTNGFDMNLFDVKQIQACPVPVRGLLECAELFEWSPVPVPANPRANATAVKMASRYFTPESLAAFAEAIRAGTEPLAAAKILAPCAPPAKGPDHQDKGTEMTIEIKSVCGAKRLPLAERDHPWDKDGADKRVRDFTEATDAPNKSYAKAFILCDGDGDKYGDFKLPFADIVDDEMVAVPKGIESAAGALDGARGGLKDVSDEDRDGAKKLIDSYYTKMAKEFDDDSMMSPWKQREEDEKSASAGAITLKSQYLGRRTEYDITTSALQAMIWDLCDVLYVCLCGQYGYDDDADDWVLTMLDPEEAKTSAFGAIDEFATFAKAIYTSLTALNGDDAKAAKVEAEKIFRAMGASNDPLSGAHEKGFDPFGDGLPAGRASYKKQTSAVLAAVQLCVQRGAAIAALRKKEGRVLSQATKDKLTDIHKALCDSVDDLGGMLSDGSSDDDSDSSTDGSGKGASPSAETKSAADAMRVQTLMQEVKGRELHSRALRLQRQDPATQE